MRRANAAASTSTLTRIRSPAVSTISMRPIGSGAAGAPSSSTLTGKSFTASTPPLAALLASWRRQVNNRLALTP